MNWNPAWHPSLRAGLLCSVPSVGSDSGFLIWSMLFSIPVEEDEVMISFDVTTLFTPVDLDRAKKVTRELLQEYNPDKSLGTWTLWELLDLCLIHLGTSQRNTDGSTQYGISR